MRKNMKLYGIAAVAAIAMGFACGDGGGSGAAESVYGKPDPVCQDSQCTYKLILEDQNGKQRTVTVNKKTYDNCHRGSGWPACKIWG